MAMNSRERVMAAFEHEPVDHVPCWCGASEEFWAKAKSELNLDDEALRIRFGDDFRRVFEKYAGPEFPLSEKAALRTVFGVERAGIGWGQPLSHPLAEATLKQVHDYPWPDLDWVKVSSIRSDAQTYNGRYAILGGAWSAFFHDIIDLLGMENMYIRMYTEPEVIKAILDHVVDFYVEISKRIFDAAADVIDIFFIGNDFGGQTGPLMSPEMFKDFILPYLKRLIDLGHSYNLKVQMHCCGGIAPLIPIFIDAGLDGIHALQPSCTGMDLRKLKEDFGSKILLNGGIDSHHVLIEGTVELVREKTRQVLDIMTPGSGYVAGASHDTILQETPMENVLAMFDTIAEYKVNN